MNKYILGLILIWIAAFKITDAHGQQLIPVVQTIFQESQYTTLSEGLDPEFAGKFYSVRYRRITDTNYTMKKIYRDSTKAMLIMKRFYKKNITDGPFSQYANNILTVQGTFENGKLNGERLTYKNSIVTQKAYFLSGKKNGTWYEYNTLGQLKRTIVHTTSGLIQSIQQVQANTQTATSGAQNQ